MKNNKIDIVRIKNGNINDPGIRDSLITKFLLPSNIFLDENNKNIKNSYEFLEINKNLKLEKFYKSLQYFEMLENELIKKDFKISSDNFFDITSNELFVLQCISEFTNFKFDYTNEKNYYKKFLEENNLQEISEKIITLNNYISIISKIFDCIDINAFEISSRILDNLNEYLNQFENKKIFIKDVLFGRNLKLEDLIKKIKIDSFNKNKNLFNKIRVLELDSQNYEFIIQEDFLKFLFYVVSEIKEIFIEVISKLIKNIKIIWQMNENAKEIKLNNKNFIDNQFNEEIKNDDECIIEEFDKINKNNDEFIIEEFDEINKNDDEFIIEEFDEINKNYGEFINDSNFVTEEFNEINKNDDEFINDSNFVNEEFNETTNQKDQFSNDLVNEVINMDNNLFNYQEVESENFSNNELKSTNDNDDEKDDAKDINELINKMYGDFQETTLEEED